MRFGRQLSPAEAEWRVLTDELEQTVDASRVYTSHFRRMHFGDEVHPFRTHKVGLTFETERNMAAADTVGSIYVPVGPMAEMTRLVIQQTMPDEGMEAKYMQLLEDERTGIAVVRGGCRAIRRPDAIRFTLATIERPIPAEMTVWCDTKEPGYVIGQDTRHLLSVEKDEFADLPDGARAGMHDIVNGIHSAIKELYVDGQPIPAVTVMCRGE